jgi:Alg9-like mannosyltransferase family
MAAAAPWHVFSLLLSLRIVNSLVVRTFFQPDEYFQSLEPAWRLAFGDDSGAWITWVYCIPSECERMRARAGPPSLTPFLRNGATDCGRLCIPLCLPLSIVLPRPSQTPAASLPRPDLHCCSPLQRSHRQCLPLALTTLPGVWPESSMGLTVE